MRTTMIAALMLLTATPAVAETDWVAVSQSDDSAFTTYIDVSSINITGSIRRFWERRDYVNNPKGWKQAKVLKEANCASGQSRKLQFTIYFANGTNAGGAAPDQSWEYVVPDTVGGTVQDYVCGK